MTYHQLSNNWVLWYHDPFDTKWDISSYVKITTIDTIELFWGIFNILESSVLIEGMYFLMKEGIEPLWENELNINGGCWSYRIQKKIAYTSWIDLSVALCGNTLTKDNYLEKINGISISPKKTFCIIKIWNNDSNINDINIISQIKNLDNTQGIFRAHKERN